MRPTRPNFILMHFVFPFPYSEFRVFCLCSFSSFLILVLDTPFQGSTCCLLPFHRSKLPVHEIILVLPYTLVCDNPNEHKHAAAYTPHLIEHRNVIFPGAYT